MGEVTELPENFIGKDDRERLEAFGGHTIGRGRATRWHWDRDTAGDDRFALYAGGAEEHCIASVARDRSADLFRAFDADRRELANGDLEHVMASLDLYLQARHGELPDTPA